jgi:hypothetical protein
MLVSTRALKVVCPSLLLLATAAAAKKPERLTHMNDEPNSPTVALEPTQAADADAVPWRTHYAGDSSTLREVRMVAPAPQAPTVDAAPAAVSERGVAAQPPPREQPAAVSGALGELIAHQMARFDRPIQECIDGAMKRNPGAHGTVTLGIRLQAPGAQPRKDRSTLRGESARKGAHVEVASDDLHDAVFNQCLLSASATWTFSFKETEFSWPITLGVAPQANARIPATAAVVLAR